MACPDGVTYRSGMLLHVAALLVFRRHDISRVQQSCITLRGEGALTVQPQGRWSLDSNFLD